MRFTGPVAEGERAVPQSWTKDQSGASVGSMAMELRHRRAVQVTVALGVVGRRSPGSDRGGARRWGWRLTPEDGWKGASSAAKAESPPQPASEDTTCR